MSWANEPTEKQRFFAGYSGWGGGQLEGELQTGSWLTVPASASHIFDYGIDQLWNRVFQEIVDDNVWNQGFAPRKDDPSLN